MRWVQLNTSGSIAVDLPKRPGGAGSAVVRDLHGGALETITPTLDAVSTTLSALAAAGAGSLALTSASGVTAGRVYLVGGAEAEGGEAVTARALSGSTLTLVRRLERERASGATFQSARLSFAITTASTAVPRRNARIEWTNPDTGEVVPIPFDVTRYAPVSTLTAEVILGLDPQFKKRLAAGEWLPGRIAIAWDMLLGHIAAQVQPGGLIGTVDLTTAHGYLVRALAAETAGKDAAEEYVMLSRRYAEERERVLTACAYDERQTGNASNRRGYHRSINLVRG